MKRYFLILILIMTSCRADVPETLSNNLVQSDAQKITLERVSVKRILNKRSMFKAKIKRSKRFAKGFYWTTGALTTTTVFVIGRYLWNSWFADEADDTGKPVNSTQTIRPEDIALYVQPGLQEYLERQGENRTFMGLAKNTMFDGFHVALYTFVAALVLNLFYYVEAESLTTIKNLLNEDELWLFGLSYKDIITNIGRLQSSTYAFIQDLNYLVSDKESSSMDFITYFNGDVVVDFASVVNSIEEVIAIISESFFELPTKAQQVEADIDELMNQLIEQTDAFAEYLESIVNKDEPFDSNALIRQIHVLFRKFSVTITSYASNCGSLMFGREFVWQNEGRL